MTPLKCPRQAGNAFRPLLNEASETTEGSTGETTETTTEPHTEDTTEGTTGETTEGTTAELTQRCTGWFGQEHRKLIRLSAHAAMRDMEDSVNRLPEKFPLCGSFNKRDGYNKLKICMTAGADGRSVDFVIRSKEYLLDIPKEKGPASTQNCARRVDPWFNTSRQSDVKDVRRSTQIAICALQRIR
jgi:hypothetical protein